MNIFSEITRGKFLRLGIEINVGVKVWKFIYNLTIIYLTLKLAETDLPLCLKEDYIK